MHTINIKGVPTSKDKKMVKLTMIFFLSGYCRAKKVLNIIGLLSDWNEDKQCFNSRNSENQVKKQSPIRFEIEISQSRGPMGTERR